MYHQNSVSRKSGAKPPAPVSKKTPVNLTKKPAQVVPQAAAPQIKANIMTKEKPKKTGKLGFASNKKKEPEPVPQALPSPVIEAPQQDAEMSDGDRKASVEDLS